MWFEKTCRKIFWQFHDVASKQTNIFLTWHICLNTTHESSLSRVSFLYVSPGCICLPVNIILQITPPPCYMFP